jgi:serine/threonine-protein kinase
MQEKQLQKGESVDFFRTKSYIFIRNIGQGATGKTILLKDEIIDETFVCKKYSTYYPEHQHQYFEPFKKEIKILHKVYHKNIVRVFNYYLYPDKTTGYILMEFIEGKNIDIFIQENPDKLNDIFIQTITGFLHLEENNILHRDIRPNNILVTHEGITKIIDFGFGKQPSDNDKKEKSVSLNWRYAIPDEFTSKIYDRKTEIYFVGKMFEEILGSFSNIDFKYRNLLPKMTPKNPSERIASFFDIYRETLEQKDNKIEFSDKEMEIYRCFADNLIPIFGTIPRGYYEKNIEKVITLLQEVYDVSMLEEYVQNNQKFGLVFFTHHKFSYAQPYINAWNIRNTMDVSNLKEMIELLNNCSADKKKIILNNLWQRFDRIENSITDDDLPF